MSKSGAIGGYKALAPDAPSLDGTGKALTLAFVGIILSLLLAVWLGGEDLGRFLAREDGPVEDCQALLYLLGACVSAYAFMRGNNRPMAALWLVLCILFLGEETSWFQRVFDYHVLWVESGSSQSEFNLHNLTLFGESRFINPDGSVHLSFSALLNSQNLFRAGFFAWFLFAPLLAGMKPLAGLAARLGYVRPPFGFLVALWGVLIAAAALTLHTVPPIKDYVAEVTELGYATAIFLYTLFVAQSSIRPQTMPSRASAGRT